MSGIEHLVTGAPGVRGAEVFSDEVKNIEADRLFAKINDQITEKSQESVRPTRLVDSLNDRKKSALVDSALAIVNRIRKKAGKAPLDDLPRAMPGDSGECVLARAFDGKAQVGGDVIDWGDAAYGEAATAVLGAGSGSSTPNPTTFATVVSAFDSHDLKVYEEDPEDEDE